jgi:hypothetical protein
LGFASPALLIDCLGHLDLQYFKHKVIFIKFLRIRAHPEKPLRDAVMALRWACAKHTRAYTGVAVKLLDSL